MPCKALPPSQVSLLAPQPTLTDALVHVCIAKAEVAQGTGGQANPDLPDVVPLQKDEELGGTSQAPVELGAQVTAPGTALTQLSANWKRRGSGQCPHSWAWCALASVPKHQRRGAGTGVSLGFCCDAALCGSWHCFPMPSALRCQHHPEQRHKSLNSSSSEEQDPAEAPALHSPSTASSQAPHPCWADTHNGQHLPTVSSLGAGSATLPS